MGRRGPGAGGTFGRAAREGVARPRRRGTATTPPVAARLVASGLAAALLVAAHLAAARRAAVRLVAAHPAAARLVAVWDWAAPVLRAPVPGGAAAARIVARLAAARGAGKAARRVRQGAVLGAVLMAAVAGAATEAAAGAWTRAPGEGQVISTTGRRAAPISALAGGVPQDEAASTAIFVEYGLIEGLTLGATAYAEISSVDPTDASVLVGLHLRQRLWVGQHGDVASVQVSAAAPVESYLSPLWGASEPDSVAEFGLRGQYGKGWAGDWGSAFVSLEGGYLIRAERAADELRLDTTVGFAPWSCCLMLLSSYASLPVQDGDATLKLAPSIAYTWRTGWGRNDRKPRRVRPTTVQLGVTYDLLNPDDGLGVSVGIWRAF